jgi:hypothetical protein
MALCMCGQRLLSCCNSQNKLQATHVNLRNSLEPSSTITNLLNCMILALVLIAVDSLTASDHLQ